MRRALFFIVVALSAATSFASIPRASMLDAASPAAESLSETRVWASEVLAPWERPAESELSRAVRQAYADSSTTSASGLRCFLSVDPTWESADLGKPQSWNRYAYVRNNPVNMTDPDGKVPIDPAELAKALIGAASKYVAGYVLDADAISATADLPADPAERAKHLQRALDEATYKRPGNATTPTQRAAHEGAACDKCGKDDGGKRVAGHRKALVQEHYETGTIDKQKMRSIEATRPECTRCSAQEGAAMSRYSRAMKKALQELVKKLL